MPNYTISCQSRAHPLSGVSNPLSAVSTCLSGVSNSLNGVSNPLSGVSNHLSAVRNPLSGVCNSPSVGRDSEGPVVTGGGVQLVNITSTDDLVEQRLLGNETQ